jgi:hypothetical protein
LNSVSASDSGVSGDEPRHDAAEQDPAGLERAHLGGGAHASQAAQQVGDPWGLHHESFVQHRGFFSEGLGTTGGAPR